MNGIIQKGFVFAIVLVLGQVTLAAPVPINVSTEEPGMDVAPLGGSFTGWDMNLGEGLITGVGPFPSHGHDSEYTYASFPAEDDPGWGPAPDVDHVNYEQIPSTLCNVCPCLEGLEFTYFRTRVYVPSGAITFHVESGTVDDGLELSLNGVARDHAYLGGYVSTNLLPFADLGSYNDLTIVHVDDCCYHSYLYDVSILIDGDEILLSRSPVADAGPDQTVDEGETVTLDGSSSVGSIISLPPSLDVAALWHMNEDSGSVIYDESANHNDGSIDGSAWTSGKFGKALSFDGFDDNVEVQDDLSLDLTDEITIEAWINLDVVPTQQKHIVNKWMGANFASWFRTGYLLDVGLDTGDTELYVALGFGSGEWRPFTTTSLDGTWSTGVWYHVAFTYKTSLPSNNLKIYRNGQMIDQFDETRAIAQNGIDLYIGRNNPNDTTTPGNPFFDGKTDEVIIWNRALSSTEIQDNYNSGKEHFAEYQAKIVSYEWDFESDGTYDYQETLFSAPDGAFDGATTYTYGDKGYHTVTLRITDEFNEKDTDTCVITVYNAPPDVHINTPFVYTLTQSDNTWTIPAIEGILTPTEFYDYYSVSAHTGLEVPYQSFFYLYRDITDPTDEVGLFIIHDIDGDVPYGPCPRNCGSPDAQCQMDVSGIPSGAYLAQSDDPGEFVYNPGSGTAAGRWHWWYNTDGGAIGGLTASSSWCITIKPLYWRDVDSWAYYYTGGDHINLDMTLPVTICYTPPTEPDLITINEGGVISLSGYFNDPGWLDAHTATWDLGDLTGATATFSPGVGFTHHIVDPVTHAYGDDGTYSVCLTVEDDDGGIGSDCVDIVVNNVAPTGGIIGAYSGDEGSSITFTANATDPGSDDLTFTWNWGDGTPDTKTTHFNSIGPDPPQSPLGTYPFTATDTTTHIYGDNAPFTVTLTISDDDGGSVVYTTTLTVDNLAPAITAFGHFTVDEGAAFDATAVATDPGSDDLTFTWEFELGPTIIRVYFNDGSGPDPYPSPGGTYPFTVTDTATHTYGDNGVYNLTLTVEDDDGGATSYTTTVTVINVAPTVEDVEAYTYVDFTLRVAGEKWHNVEMRIYEEGTEIGYAEVVRYPGSPDDQAVTVSDVRCDLTKEISAVVLYTPLDDPVNGQINGASPAWIILGFEGGNNTTLHHTFNVKHPDTWEWDVTFNQHLAGHEITFEVTATDPGSDDLTFTWSWGDSTPDDVTTYYNDGANPDLYPSPHGTYPFTATDVQTHTYMAAGSYTLTLSVTDDDGGLTELLVTIIVI